MIIGLMGLKGSGKDTVGAYLVKQHGFERRSFAGSLKRSFAELFNIPVHDIETLKNDPSVFITLHTNYTIVHSDNPPITEVKSYPIQSMTFREALQRYGTESHRDVFGENFWVDHLLPVDGFYGGRAIVVTDVRFQNEADRINEIGGFVVRVDRPTLSEDPHRSETEQLNINADYFLQNTGTIDYLYRQIESMLEQLANA